MSSRPVARALRPATADDEPFLARVYAGTRAAELAAVAWTEEQKAAFVQMQFAAQAQYYREHYPDTSFDVIVLDGQPVGRLYVARWTDEIRIVDIALLPEFCNRGIGTTLLRSCRRKRAARASRSRIHVERFNPALRLYQRLGFTQIEDKGVYLFLEWNDRGSGSGVRGPGDQTQSSGPDQ